MNDDMLGPAAERPTVPAVSMVVRGLTVDTGRHRRLDGVDLDVAAGELLAVLGTSGAGKSTLVKALTGHERATSGTILIDGLDLNAAFDVLRRRIGYVPQDDILHGQLTVRDTLDFAAQLRFPAELSDMARRTRVQHVIDQLGLTARADARVDELSGGQRKRVNVAVELLTEPSVLILDEPTSGLDPGNERLMMDLLRRLADEGRIVVVVTHSIESLHLCDDVLFLAVGGVPIYHGPPSGLPGHVGATGMTAVFSVVEAMADPSTMRVTRAPRPDISPAVPAPAPSLLDQVRDADQIEIGRQVRIQTERYIKVLSSDRRNLLILALQAPVIAVLMFAVFGSNALRVDGVVRREAGNVLMAMVLATIWLGASNAVREIVKERAILQREQSIGLSLTAYVASKVLVLGSLTLMQAALLVIVGTARQAGPADAVLLWPAKVELFALIAVCGLSALCLGLLVSAAVTSADKAMTVLPVMLFAQFLLAGLIFPVATIGVQQLSWLVTARWGFAGVSSTARYTTLRLCDAPTAAGVVDNDCSALWRHAAAPWMLSYVMLCVLGAAALVLTWRSLARRDPAFVLRQAS